jgi:hypothetical protein
MPNPDELGPTEPAAGTCTVSDVRLLVLYRGD